MHKDNVKKPERENIVGKKTGIWIDHRKAVIASISGETENIREIPSNVEKQHGRIGGVRSVVSYESRKVAASDVQEREFTGHLNVFYDAVCAAVRDAESILLMGPGEAKGELKKRFDKKHLGRLIVGVETVDKMTVTQIAAKVREYVLT